jgi:hypothetical protein
LNSFQIYPKSDATRVSIISTCWSIDAILANPSHWSNKCKWASSSPDVISLMKAVTALTEAPWTFDAFQAPVLVSTLCKVGETGSPDKFLRAVEALLDQRSRLSLHRKQSHSTYLRFLNVCAVIYI